MTFRMQQQASQVPQQPHIQWKCLTVYLYPALVALVCVLVGCLLLLLTPEILQFLSPGSWSGPPRDALDNLHPDVAIALGPEGLRLFRQHDRDDNGLLTPEEFLPIASRLLHRSAKDLGNNYQNEQTHDAALEVICSFEPLDMKSLTKNLTDEPLETLQSFAGLKGWVEPNVPRRQFRHEDFKSFLPPTGSVPFGHPWYLVKSTLDIFAGQLSSAHHEPPIVHPNEQTIHDLFSMFHKRPFIYPRFAPQGTVAVVRARTDDVLDIVFRSHVEFQLNDPPACPFWFTPSQFKGQLTIGVNGLTVFHFHLSAAVNRKLNVDLEWLNDPGDDSTMENMEVDIGFVPRMELLADLQDVPAFDWDEEISMEEAFDRIEVTMYPFKQVPYYPFEDAFERAATEQKLVHSVVLWGALDDQSC